MNILQILPELNVGGVETGVVDLSKYLVRSGHKAVVVSAGGELVSQLKECGAIHYCLPVRGKSIISMLKAIPRLIQIIRQENIDIVHARSRVPAWIAYFACRRTRAVFITTCHGYYSRHLMSMVMGWARRVIAPSNIIARRMINDFFVPHERVRIVPRGVDLEKFKYMDPQGRRSDVFNVGIIGRLTPLKGHIHFIKAMALVSAAVPNLKVWIIGGASSGRQAYKESLQVLTKRLGLWRCTEFLGPQKNIPEILSHLDALALSTVTHEAFGRVIIEAQASGVPVAATSVGGVVDVIDDSVTGLLVPPADPRALAQAVIKIYQDARLAQTLAQNAYKKLKEKYTVEHMLVNTLAVYKDALDNFKILVIKFSSLGDVILSSAAIKAIRDKFPSNYKITVLTSEESKELLLRCPYIDELLVADFKARDKGLFGVLNLARVLSKRSFDIVFDLQNNRKSHILTFLSLAGLRYGYDNGKFGFLLNRRIKEDKALIGPLEHQFRMLNMSGIELANYSPELWPSKEDELYTDELLNSEWLSSKSKLAGINISASKKWIAKNWPLESIAKLVEQLAACDIRVVLTGGHEERLRAEELVRLIKGTKVINACAKTTVNQLACLIKRCVVFISPDSAPMHIAAAVKTPFVALFGPTEPVRHIVSGAKHIMLGSALDCAPCYKPKCRDNKCMKSISVQEVLDAARKLLQ